MIYKEYYRPQKGSRKHAASRWLLDNSLEFIFLLFIIGLNITVLMLLKPNAFLNVMLIQLVMCFFSAFFISAFHKIQHKNISRGQYKKILLIDNGHIGDVVMSTSVFKRIKKDYPNMIIDVLTTDISKPLLEKNPHIDNIITSDFFWRKEKRDWESFWKYLALIQKLKKEKYDFGIALRSDLPNILTLWFSGIPNRAAYYNLDGGKPFLTHPILYPEEEQHASLADLNLVNAALKLKYILPAPPYDEEVMKALAFPEINIDNILDTCDCAWTYVLGNYICIVPGACAKLQTWDKENYKKIIEWINKEYPDMWIFLCGGKEDESLIDELSSNKRCYKLVNHNLRHLGILFDQAECVLLQDGGPMHLAYAMMKEADRKLIILWGPNPLAHVAPLKGKIIHHKLSCYPCMRREKECKMPEGQRCMDFISVEEVKQAIREAVDGKKH